MSQKPIPPQGRNEVIIRSPGGPPLPKFSEYTRRENEAAPAYLRELKCVIVLMIGLWLLVAVSVVVMVR